MPGHLKKRTKIAMGVAICAVVSVSYIAYRIHQIREQTIEELSSLPTEYGPLPKEYSAHFCDKFPNEFYSDLCHETIDDYGKIHHFKGYHNFMSDNPNYNIHDPNIHFTDNQIQFENDFKFAADTCCESLKPNESDKNDKYCDAQSDTGKRATGCETYRECIKNAISQPNIKDCIQSDLKESSDDNQVNPSMDDINH